MKPLELHRFIMCMGYIEGAITDKGIKDCLSMAGYTSSDIQLLKELLAKFSEGLIQGR